MRSEDPEAVKTAALEQQVGELQLRNAVLEEAMEKYRLQMAGVYTSLSWRVTHPVRQGIAIVRRTRTKVKGLPKRVRERGQITTPTTGLFYPDLSGVADWVDSPLLRSGLPADLRRPTRTAPPATAKVLVVAHVYYPEIWTDIEHRLGRLPEAFDLVVTLVKGKADNLAEKVSGAFPGAHIRYVENHGRDIWPFVELANEGWFEDYDAVLKVHTKRSPHRVDGDVWRLSMLDGLMPNPDGIGRILELLRADRHVGVVCPPGAVESIESWGSNREIVHALACRLPVAYDPETIRYPAGSMYWMRPFLLQRLADLALTAEDFAVEASLLDGTTPHAIERLLGVMAHAAGLDQVETNEVAARLTKVRKQVRDRPRTLAFYLPQFHQIPENDAWWGEGFTEWTNVAKARPIFDGQRHPIEPGELGAYDLSDPEVLRRQAALAHQHGIDGFVMYHYWFDGTRLLRKPLDNLLADPSINLPFALCWANENWTRTWDGLETDVLMAQTYADGWADRFYDDLLPALRDSRYLRVDGKPVLVVYRAGQIPQSRQVLEGWKARAKTDGLGGLHLLGVIPSREFEDLDPDGLDGLVRFPPGSGVGLQQLHPAGYVQGPTGAVYSYEAAVEHADPSTRGGNGLRIHPGVMPGWDNTARRGGAAYAFHGANPLSFRRWVAKAAKAAADAGRDPLLFINAWNEWAEGAYLEPDARFGLARLQAVSDALGPARVTR
jgi:lipopolysaccharide biosynthesis protein